MKNKLLKGAVASLTTVLILAALPYIHIERIDYNTQVKPILNKHCMSCHGGVKRQAGFSLLTREDALAATESGHPAIIPGNPEKSEMIRRLKSHDPEFRMPFKKASLTTPEIDILQQWIKEGANFELHWSYKPLTAPKIPKPKGRFWGLWPAEADPWPKNDIDWFVLNDLNKENLQPSPQANLYRLSERLSMDLTGLPLSDALRKMVESDSSSAVYERLVDSLLASPRFGERWATPWLDLARYADTKGYERDSRRFIWRYRDWVIRAFNDDMPYDRFLQEQLAGDLLPQPTEDQYIATAFHRNTMTNDEGGTDNEEFRVAAVIDRVNTTWTALMGTSFNCVQCHSHPYDPFKHEEYYRFLAFFNNTRDEDTWEDYPAFRHLKSPDSLTFLRFNTWLGQHVSPAKAAEIEQFITTWQPAYYSIASDSFLNCELYDTKWLIMRNHAQARLKQVQLEGCNQLIWRFDAAVKNGSLSIRLDRPDGPELLNTIVQQSKGREIQSIDFQPVSGTHDLWLCYENPSLSSPDASGLMFDWLRFTESFPGRDQEGWASAQDTFWQLLRAPSEFTPVMIENPANMARQTKVFERGNWLVPGQSVEADVPHIFNQMEANEPRNRLGLARWLCDKQNPLTARTMVNRVWEQIFGTGLAETLEDLGSQGIPPKHQELLDYLSWRFMNDHQWSIKQLLREIVLSATYRQDSQASPQVLERDPRNEWLARGPRVRLSAEQIRDKVLAVSGLLSTKMYGPGVMPYQPAGVWKSPWSGDEWKQSEGEDEYRRSIYTFVKRTSSYPAALTFDLASRESCAARRTRTNTPLQALVTLNDSALVSAARFLADTIQNSVPGNATLQISKLYKRAIGSVIDAETSRALEKLYAQALSYYSSHPAETGKLLGKKTVQSKNEPAWNERAALTLVANAVLNLDEFVTKS